LAQQKQGKIAHRNNQHRSTTTAENLTGL